MKKISTLSLPNPPRARASALSPTEEQVRARTRDIALRAGRPANEIKQRDYEQAKLELTTESKHQKPASLPDAVPPGRAQPQTGDHPQKPESTYVLEPESFRERSEIEQLLLEPDFSPPSKPQDDSGPVSFAAAPALNPPPASN